MGKNTKTEQKAHQAAGQQNVAGSEQLSKLAAAFKKGNILSKAGSISAFSGQECSVGHRVSIRHDVERTKAMLTKRGLYSNPQGNVAAAASKPAVAPGKSK